MIYHSCKILFKATLFSCISLNSLMCQNTLQLVDDSNHTMKLCGFFTSIVSESIWYLLVKGHHTSSYSHIHWYLCRHSTNQKHLLMGVWMECWIIQLFSFPQFILRQTRDIIFFPWKYHSIRIDGQDFKQINGSISMC